MLEFLAGDCKHNYFVVKIGDQQRIFDLCIRVGNLLNFPITRARSPHHFIIDGRNYAIITMDTFRRESVGGLLNTYVVFDHDS